MNWEKGIKRAVLVLSIAVPVLGCQYMFIEDPYSGIDGNVKVFVYSIMFSINIWIGYYAVRWIIKGLRDENKKETQEVKEQ